jgi:hypothetical protein
MDYFLGENVKGEVDSYGGFFFRNFLSKLDVDTGLNLFGGSGGKHRIIYQLDDPESVKGFKIWVTNL